jgi:hypothetical protein
MIYLFLTTLTILFGVLVYVILSNMRFVDNSKTEKVDELLNDPEFDPLALIIKLKEENERLKQDNDWTKDFSKKAWYAERIIEINDSLSSVMSGVWRSTPSTEEAFGDKSGDDLWDWGPTRIKNPPNITNIQTDDGREAAPFTHEFNVLIDQNKCVLVD